MSTSTGIPWAEATWPVCVGCTPVSSACAHNGIGCWAARQASRNLRPEWRGLAERGRWTGKVLLRPEVLDEPLRWKKPRRVFVAPMGDLFHEAVPFDFVDRVWGAMLAAHWHTFMVLTKRPERMREYQRHAGEPARNIWLGVSVEDLPTWIERVPHLAQTPAARRFVSYEPALGPLDPQHLTGFCSMDWIIMGSESGPKPRPCSWDWVRPVRDYCTTVGVYFYLKQMPGEVDGKLVKMPLLDGKRWDQIPEALP